jgi:hypothetical protein
VGITELKIPSCYISRFVEAGKIVIFCLKIKKLLNLTDTRRWRIYNNKPFKKYTSSNPKTCHMLFLFVWDPVMLIFSKMEHMRRKDITVRYSGVE